MFPSLSTVASGDSPIQPSGPLNIPEDSPTSTDSSSTTADPARDVPPGSQPVEDAPPADDAPPAEGSSTAEEPAAGPSSEEDLPEWEPLTPELVEEEAIRGDFMLRWSAILMAMLLGWMLIDQTSVLVNIKTGQYLASHGVVPSSTDVFAATTADRRWVNLSWLWDLMVSGVYGAMGLSGLSLLSAATAFVTFWIVAKVSVPGVPTWWGSICAVLAAVACFPSLTATPHIITLLGVALTMWLLFRWQLDVSRSLWPLVGVFLVWGNLDGRAWIGGVILILFWLGTWLDGFRKHPEGEPEPPAKTAGLVVLCSLAALLVNPFLWETWLAPLHLYRVEYPALRAYATSDLPFAFQRYSAVLPGFWRHLDLYTVVSLLLMMIAAVTLMLNRERLRLSSVLVLLGVNLIGIAGGRELAVAAIVNAILATVNAQQWYRVTIRQTYSVEPSEILFSRGGRALTVLAIFGLAFAVVSGHLMGAGARRVGMGLAPELAQQIESYQSLLADSFDDRAFNFRLSQGDILIWIGMKPFIDSRVGLYGGADSLVPRHHILRRSMRASTDNHEYEEMKALWAEAFDEYQINQVLPRLSGMTPDYVTFYSLLKNPDWQLAGQDAASASFYRTDTADAELAAYLREHDSTQFVSRFLRTDDTETEPPIPRGVWPQPPTFYDRYFYLPQETTSNGIRLAGHYDVLRELSLEDQRLDDAIALAYEAIRTAREGLRDDPNNAAGYRILATSYQFLEAAENSFQQSRGLPHPLAGRFHETIASYHQALNCDPHDVETMYRLFTVYNTHNRYDLALKYLELVEYAKGSTSILPLSHPNQREQQQLNDVLKVELQEGVARVRAQVEADLQSEKDRLAAARAAYASGCPELALNLLEEDLTVSASDPLAQLFMGILLLEVGRTSEARDQLESLRGTAVEEQVPEWPLMASYGSLAADDLVMAEATLEKAHAELEEVATIALLNSLPLRFVGPIPTPDGTLGWGDGEGLSPVRQAQSVALLKTAYQLRLEQNELLHALIAIEAGNISDATELFEQIITRNPNSGARPLVEQYLALIADQQLAPPQPVVMPLEPDLFAEADTERPDNSDEAESKDKPEGAEPSDKGAASSPASEEKPKPDETNATPQETPESPEASENTPGEPDQSEEN